MQQSSPHATESQGRCGTRSPRAVGNWAFVGPRHRRDQTPEAGRSHRKTVKLEKIHIGAVRVPDGPAATTSLYRDSPCCGQHRCW